MAGKQTTSNVQAGIFLIVGIVLAVVISFVLSGQIEKLTPRTNYMVLISLREGADGLKKGSQVLLGGQPIGTVEKVDLKDDPEIQGLKCVFVQAAVRRDFQVYDDALLLIERPLLGSLAKLNFVSLGNEKKDKPAKQLAEGGQLRAYTAPPAFMAQAGFGEEQRAKVQKIIADTESAMSKVAELVDRNDDKVDSIVSNADTVVRDIKDATPGVIDDVKQTTANVRDASTKVGPIVDNIGKGVDDGRAFIKNADGLVTENRPKISEFMDRANSIAKKIDEQGVSQALAAIKDFQSALERVSSLIREEAPSLRKTLANARIASDQLKLAITEVRSQPWRVFYQPNRKEVESSVLYDATRSYATAVSDLRAASESLEAAVSAPVRGDSPNFERQSLGELNGRLRDAFTNYAAAEKALLEKLMKDAGDSAGATAPK